MDIAMMQLAFVFMVILLSTYLISHHSRYKNHKGPTVWPFVGCLPQFAANVVHLFDWTTQEILKQGNTTRYTFFFPCQSMNIVHTADRKNVEYVLNTSNFGKGYHVAEAFQELFGHGILNVDAAAWLFQRKLFTRALTLMSSRLQAMSFVRHSIDQKLLPYIQKAASQGTAIDLQSLFKKLTFDTTFQMAFGEDPNTLESENSAINSDALAFNAAYGEAAKTATERLHGPSSLYKVKRYLNIGSERKLTQAVQLIDKFMENMIQKRRKMLELEQGKDASGFLTVLLQVDESEKSHLSDNLLRDVTVNLIFSGRDTQALALSWLFWLISLHPEVEANILKEIRTVRSTGQEAEERDAFSCSSEQLSQMHYLHAAINETLRLYPSVPWNARIPVRDDILPDGTVVHKGQFVCCNFYSMGRMPSLWGSDCLEFKPERWLRNGEFIPVHSSKFCAFSSGPRYCPGRELAYFQMKSVVAALLPHFSFSRVPDHEVRYELNILLSMQSGFLVTAHSRQPLDVDYVAEEHHKL